MKSPALMDEENSSFVKVKSELPDEELDETSVILRGGESPKSNNRISTSYSFSDENSDSPPLPPPPPPQSTETRKEDKDQGF